ncbi:MAG: PucR family transcriptional regulator ligand-binding domain-containing protein [Blautia sp.]|nr:PucR family transcriptional regulator ligand-binding domain-containing protein [Blautia sp.]
MGFTIEDMLLVSGDRYKMQLAAGKDGWSNSISWLLLLEERTIIRNFSGKELAVTTGLGFQSEEALLQLAEDLYTHNASGLIVNTGFYIMEIPDSVLHFCDENGFPLLTVPWKVYLADMIKDLSIRVFIQSTTDEQISGALIHAIENPESRDHYVKELLPYFDLDGNFQVAVVTTGELDKMDTVERKRLSYRLQLYLTNLTHNGHFFYYDSYFVIIMNALTQEQTGEIVNAFAARLKKKLPEQKICIGLSDVVPDISNLHIAYKRARAAAAMAAGSNRSLCCFSDMGIYRLLYSIEDRMLLKDYAQTLLEPLLEHDRKHHGDYICTLSNYLKHDGSIKTMAEEMFIHRNTILYRMNNIKELLGCDLEDARQKMQYLLACMILDMGESAGFPEKQ